MNKYIFCYFAILLFSFSCQQEHNSLEKNTTLTTREEGFPFSNYLQNYSTIQNEIICFQNFQTFKNYIQFIKEFESDTNNINTAQNYLTNNSISLSPNPVLEVIEIMNQFYSIRKKFDEDFMNAMNNNVENLAEYKHFLMDPYLESVFNQYNEVKIGSIYFRLLDKNRTLIVGNDDYSKFLITRGQIFNDNFNIDNNIFVFNNGISDLNLIFNETETDVRSTLKPMVFADFKYTLSVNNKIQFHNSSFFDDLAGTSPNYIWTFST